MKKILAGCLGLLLASSMIPAIPSYADEDGIGLYVNGRPTGKICVDYSAEEENKNLLFSTSSVDYNGSTIALYDAETDEKVATLYDDGRIDEDGDEYSNDGVYSGYYNMEYKPIGSYCFYVKYTDAEGEVHTSKTVRVGVYRLFTQQELTDMSDVENAVTDLLNSDAYEQMTIAEKLQSVYDLLYELSEVDETRGYALVQRDSIEQDRYMFKYVYACGVEGYIQAYHIPGTNSGSEEESTSSEAFTYTNHETYIEITGFDNSVKDVVIPSEIDGLPVTEIGKSAFLASTMTSVKIPDTVTTIGEMAFGACVRMESVSIPHSVTTIGKSAFNTCKSLTEVTIPESVTTIETGAFGMCAALQSITFLNPNCVFDGNGSIVNNRVEGSTSAPYSVFEGTIYGYENSTAQAFAAEQGYSFSVIQTPVTTTTTTKTTETTTTTVTETTTTLTAASTAATTTQETETTENTTTVTIGETTVATTVTTTESGQTVLYGDINADAKIDLLDCITLNKYLANIIDLSEQQLKSADCYLDYNINEQDSKSLMQYLVFLIDTLPEKQG